MDNIEFYYKTKPGCYIMDDLEYLWPGKFKTKHISELNDNNADKFLVVPFSRDIKNYLFSYEFLDDARAIINKGGKVLIDYLMEADTAIRPCIVYLLENIYEAHLPPSEFIWVSNNSYHMEPFEVSIREFKMTTVYFPHFYIQAHKKQQEYYQADNKLYDDQKATHDFLMLNRRVGRYKFPPIHELVSRGWRDRSLMTFIDMRPDLKGCIRSNPAWMQTLSKLGLTYPINTPLQLEGDVEYGTGLAWSDEHLYTVNPLWYEKAKVNIVVETWAHDYIEGWDHFDNMVHHTEKIFKSIGFNSPFVVISGKGYLDRLKRLGFEVDFLQEGWNSSDYDYADYSVRYKLALDKAQHYAQNYNSEVMKEVTLFNQKHFLNLNNQRKVVKAVFLNPLIKDFSLI